MKRISTIIMALVVVMTMAQCKKDSPTTPDNLNNVVTITLDVKNNNGSRVDVNTTTGTVDFETGDKVYVGSGGKYVGFLTHNGTNFSGNITNPTENQPLQFYFLGNVMPTETLSAGTTEECSVIISDQTEHLPVISCAASNENYVSGVTAYSSHLLNKCALVKFNVTTPSNSPICITGMKNKVTVDFTQNTITPSQDGDGVIMLPAGSGENVEKWAILLPQEALEVGSAYTEDGAYMGTRSEIPVINENSYLAEGIIVTVNTNSAPIGAINGLFSVSATKQVYFSKGNLQYIGSASTPYWKFAENQWDCIAEAQEGNSQTIDRDLFGWGTSGWNNGNLYYQPYNLVGTDDGNTGYGYGPTDGTSYNYHLTNNYANADWGIYNAISNGGNLPNQWRTLTISEWHYVFNRSTPSGILYAKAKVNDVNGIILLPDNWNNSVYMLNHYNLSYVPYTSNEITAENWAIMENKGAVFLPAAGGRYGESILYLGNYGVYWSTSACGTYYAYNMHFQNGQLFQQNFSERGIGFSVRLVCDY